MNRHPLCVHARTGPVANISEFRDAMAELLSQIGSLADEYEAEREAALAVGGRPAYFQARHDAFVGGDKPSNRFEEHLAMALLRRKTLPIGSGSSSESLTILDYQVPLQTSATDADVGKVDLLAVGGEQLHLIELKISRNERDMDAPLRALLEGLAYHAVVEAHRGLFLSQIRERHGLVLADLPPVLAIMAPSDYWWFYSHAEAAGDWLPQLRLLTDAIQDHKRLGMTISYLSLEGCTSRWSEDPRTTPTPSSLRLRPFLP